MKVRPAPVAALLKRLLRVGRVSAETAEGRFFVDPASQFGRRLLDEREFEPAMTASLKAILRPGATFVDLGANEGYFSVLAATLAGPSGRVIAVEPQQRAAAVLLENLARNGLANVEVVRAAVGAASGMGRLYLTASTSTGASGLIRPTRYPLPSQTVPVVRLEELLDERRIALVDALKIDIEGGEYDAIFGSRRVFEEGRVATMFLELHPRHLARIGRSAEELLSFLGACGYLPVPKFGNLVLSRLRSRLRL